MGFILSKPNLYEKSVVKFLWIFQKFVEYSFQIDTIMLLPYWEGGGWSGWTDSVGLAHGLLLWKVLVLLSVQGFLPGDDTPPPHPAKWHTSQETFFRGNLAVFDILCFDIVGFKLLVKLDFCHTFLSKANFCSDEDYIVLKIFQNWSNS